jgi:hypothetical protein
MKMTSVLDKWAMAHHGENASEFAKRQHIQIHRSFKEGFLKLAVGSFLELHMHLQRQEGLAKHIATLNEDDAIGSRGVTMPHGVKWTPRVAGPYDTGGLLLVVPGIVLIDGRLKYYIPSRPLFERSTDTMQCKGKGKGNGCTHSISFRGDNGHIEWQSPSHVVLMTAMHNKCRVLQRTSFQVIQVGGKNFIQEMMRLDIDIVNPNKLYQDKELNAVDVELIQKILIAPNGSDDLKNCTIKIKSVRLTTPMFTPGQNDMEHVNSLWLNGPEVVRWDHDVRKTFTNKPSPAQTLRVCHVDLIMKSSMEFTQDLKMMNELFWGVKENSLSHCCTEMNLKTIQLMYLADLTNPRQDTDGNESEIQVVQARNIDTGAVGEFMRLLDLTVEEEDPDDDAADDTDELDVMSDEEEMGDAGVFDLSELHQGQLATAYNEYKDVNSILANLDLNQVVIDNGDENRDVPWENILLLNTFGSVGPEINPDTLRLETIVRNMPAEEEISGDSKAFYTLVGLPTYFKWEYLCKNPRCSIAHGGVAPLCAMFLFV